MSYSCTVLNTINYLFAFHLEGFNKWEKYACATFPDNYLDLLIMTYYFLELYSHYPENYIFIVLTTQWDWDIF